VAQVLRERHPQLTLEISLNEPYDGRGRRAPDIDIRNEPVDLPPRLIDGYHRHELVIEDFLVVLPGNHPLASESVIEVARLQHEVWIDHDIYDSPTGQIIVRACQAAGFTPRYSARLDDHHAALSLVAAGLGITVLPRLALAALPPTLTTRPLEHPRVRRRIVAHTRRDPRGSRVVATALSALRDQVRSPA
jgi:DNA-binding transcriptional LysR family regulator